jgi:hypothetical protein
MATQNYFVFTSSQRTAAIAFNGEDYQIDPRLIDALTPGVGINLNANATGVNAGASIDLSGGKYVAPVRIVNDPAYVTAAPDLVAYLNTLPCAILENETIFAPADGI